MKDLEAILLQTSTAIRVPNDAKDYTGTDILLPLAEALTAIQTWHNTQMVAELESLLHEPQMHGDWEQVIDDLINRYKEGTTK